MEIIKRIFGDSLKFIIDLITIIIDSPLMPSIEIGAIIALAIIVIHKIIGR